MIIDDTLGFIFDAKAISIENSVGLINIIKLSQRENKRRITITIGIDTNGNIVKPSYFDNSLGFTPITKDKLPNLVKGNKSLYSMVGDFAVILSGYFYINIDTDTIIDYNNVHFYIPKNIMSEYKGRRNPNGDIVPVIIGDIISNNSNELNALSINNELLKSYYNNAFSKINLESTESKQIFLEKIFFEDSK